MDFYDGKLLREARAAKSVTQYELALEMGLFPSQISRIECRKQKFTKTFAIAASTVLGVDISFFTKSSLRKN